MSGAIAPRLARLLEILLAQDAPVSVDALARMLDASRRTIFREIENADAVLSRYHVELDSRPGRGVQLICPPGERERFVEALRSGPARPGARRERLLCLLVRLLACDGVIQKLFYYACDLGVSESTVSNDLDLLEPYLAGYNLRLVRRPGAGVYVLGEEERIRAALTARLVRDNVDEAVDGGITGGAPGSFFRVYGYPPEEIEDGVRELVSELDLSLGWMTGESRAYFAVFLMVTAERIQAGRVLERFPAQSDAPEARAALAGLLAGELERRFSLEKLPEAERRAILAQLLSCRSRELAGEAAGDAAAGDPPVDGDVKALAYRMIDRFDPALAPRLRVDEQLVDGLARHLAPALIRIRKKIALPAPAERIPAERYPDFFEHVRNAVRELADYLGLDDGGGGDAVQKIPETEVAYIAVYFYTALLCMDEQNIHKRVLRAGIVCVAGIGVSYMIASQLRKRYKGELEIEISGWNDQAAWERMDFLIATLPLEPPAGRVPRPVIQVHAILEDEDYRKIRAFINERAFVARIAAGSGEPRERRSLARRIEKTVPVLEQTWALLSGFTVAACDGGVDMDGLCRFAGERFGEGPDGAETVRRDLLAREALSTQIVEALGIALLHVRTAGVAAPVFAVIVPRGAPRADGAAPGSGGGAPGAFTHPYLKGAKSCVLMMLPQGRPPEMTGVMGRLSGALVDMPLFLEAAQRGDEATLRAVAEAELTDLLIQYCNEKLKT